MPCKLFGTIQLVVIEARFSGPQCKSDRREHVFGTASGMANSVQTFTGSSANGLGRGSACVHQKRIGSCRKDDCYCAVTERARHHTPTLLPCDSIASHTLNRKGIRLNQHPTISERVTACAARFGVRRSQRRASDPATHEQLWSRILTACAFTGDDTWCAPIMQQYLSSQVSAQLSYLAELLDYAVINDLVP